jgi:hypothetical protein
MSIGLITSGCIITANAKTGKVEDLTPKPGSTGIVVGLPDFYFGRVVQLS